MRAFGLTRLAWGFSLIIFIAVNLFGYYYMPNYIALFQDSNGIASGQFEKADIYLIFFAGFTVFNVFILAITKQIDSFPFDKLNFPNKENWLKFDDGIYDLQYFFKTSVFVLALFFNIVIALFLINIWQANEGGMVAINSFSFLPFVVLVFIVMWPTITYLKLKSKKALTS